MKDIIICGPSRAGKTTLARRVHEAFGHYVVSVDRLVATFAGAYPQLDIRLNWDRRRTTENIAPFLGHFMGMFSGGEGAVRALSLGAHEVAGSRFVLEGAYFDLDAVAEILRGYGVADMRERFTLIGLVQNAKTAEDFARDFRRYDTEDDWTYGMSEADLLEIGGDAVAFSRAMTEGMARHGFTLYDTSVERARVLEGIVEALRAQG